MDASKKIVLHPKAKDFLFENFAVLRRIFSDVLGQLDISYISIALLNKENEIFFLSSNPSIEQNLIEKELWEYHTIYQDQFIIQNELKLWSELPSSAYPELLEQYKFHNQKLREGVSIPIDYDDYRAVFSFGFKKMDSLFQNKANNGEKFITVGKYCLNKISKVVLFPDKKRSNVKPKLTLIINRLGESCT